MNVKKHKIKVDYSIYNYFYNINIKLNIYTYICSKNSLQFILDNLIYSSLLFNIRIKWYKISICKIIKLRPLLILKKETTLKSRNEYIFPCSNEGIVLNS